MKQTDTNKVRSEENELETRTTDEDLVILESNAQTENSDADQNVRDMDIVEA
ncbi:hypothetical protein K0M31_001894 [Melipona bicolor]|uniref:Uncharacterized protein n=1 Tax=Melipona bicolor TaxID=60889 RepID=A0AA40GGF8_9HYME|nr:hypothetical protein K0M31_001894 [Melipona bicolor]